MNPNAGVEYRPMGVDDLEVAHSIFCQAEGGLLRRHGYDWSDPSFDSFAATIGHLLRHDSARCFVATSAGVVSGISAAYVRDDRWFLAALFIDPAVQGQGIGRHLFELAFDNAPEQRMTITDAIQPISNALYARHGLIPMTPIFGFEGAPRGVRASDLVAGPASVDALRAIDLGAYGFDRGVDHVFWASASQQTLWSRDGTPVAYSYHWPNGRIGPIGALDEESAAAALRTELARSESAPFVEVPGSAGAMVSAALAAGMRISPPPGLLLLSRGIVPPRALALSGYFLM